MKRQTLYVGALAFCLLLSSVGCTNSNTSSQNATTEEAATTSTSKTEITMVTTPNGTEIPSLKDVYQNDFLIGTIYAPSSLKDNDIALTKNHFNVITPENNMKPESLQQKEGNFTYDTADLMIQFAKTNDLKVVGHNLAWHQQSPSWMAADPRDREAAIAQLKDHITNVVTHYKGQLISWDVVNEAIADGQSLPADGDWTKCLRKTQWYNAIGPEYLAMAFQFAKEADPDCKLYYNDYNLEIPQKADVAYAMIKDFLEQGVPIDGIGLQGHMQTGTAMNGLDYALNLFSTLDIEISVTELDVTCNDTADGRLTEDGELKQAITYAEIFQTLKNYSDKIERVTFWGSVDTQSWRKESCPLLFDNKYEPKQAFYAVVDPENYLKEHANTNAKLPSVEGTAVYGTPSIDGDIDDIWNNATELKINRQIMAWEGATGTFKAMWDENNLYILAEVNDSVIDTSAENDYEQDSIELFVDEGNEKNPTYDANDAQYRINADGKITFGTVPTQDGVEGIAVKAGSGYRIEMKIPFTKSMTADTTIGFEAQINDAKDGSRISVSKFCDTTDNSYMSTENFGLLKLIK